MNTSANRPFHLLTPKGKARRLRRLALDTLRQYDLEIKRVRLVGMFTNAIFRVDTVTGGRYALRVCAPDWRTDTDLSSEAIWLQYLAESCELDVPLPVAAQDGSYLVTGTAPGITGPRRCMLMSWSPGSLLGRHLHHAHLQKMGALFATLHSCSVRFTPPNNFTNRRMDRVLARGENDLLFANSSRAAFTEEFYSLFCAVRARVNQVYFDLYADPSGLRVIHHDLHHDNIKLYRGRLYPIDFEDTVWGYPVQDLAMALQDLMSAVVPERYEPLLAAMRQGYETILPWPESAAGQIDTLRAGRLLWVANYVAGHEREHLAEVIARMAPLFSAFLASGKLRRSS